MQSDFDDIFQRISTKNNGIRQKNRQIQHLQNLTEIRKVPWQAFAVQRNLPFPQNTAYLQQKLIHSVSRHSQAPPPPMPMWSAWHLQSSLWTQLHAWQSTSIFGSGFPTEFLAESPLRSRKLEQQVSCAFFASLPSTIISPLQQYLS